MSKKKIMRKTSYHPLQNVTNRFLNLFIFLSFCSWCFFGTIVAKLGTPARSSFVWIDLYSQYHGLGNPKPGIPSHRAG